MPPKAWLTWIKDPAHRKGQLSRFEALMTRSVEARLGNGRGPALIDSAATWRAWEYWANRAGCGHLLTRPDGGHVPSPKT